MGTWRYVKKAVRVSKNRRPADLSLSGSTSCPSGNARILRAKFLRSSVNRIMLLNMAVVPRMPNLSDYKTVLPFDRLDVTEPVRQKRYFQRHYNRWLCLLCPLPVHGQTRFCERHLLEKRAYMRNRLAEKRLRGECDYCAQPRLPGRWCCQHHHDLRQRHLADARVRRHTQVIDALENVIYRQRMAAAKQARADAKAAEFQHIVVLGNNPL